MARRVRRGSYSTVRETKRYRHTTSYSYKRRRAR